MTRQISIAFMDEEPATQHLLRLISRFCGVKICKSSWTSVSCELQWGETPKESAQLYIPRLGPYSKDDMKALVRDLRTFDRPNKMFPFDLFAAVKFWLLDEANSDLPDSAYDQFDRLRGPASFQGQIGQLNFPIVNAILDIFQRYLEAVVPYEKKALLPAKKKCALLISHDVDAPVYPIDPYHQLFIARTLRKRSDPKAAQYFNSVTEFVLKNKIGNEIPRPFNRMIQSTVRTLPDWMWSRIRESLLRNSNWNFDSLIAKECDSNIKSTYFFPVVSRFSEYGHRSIDVDYEITEHRFSEVIRRLLDEGHEIGLHMSFNAVDDIPNRFQSERLCLQELAKTKVIGNRHHLWHMKRPFWNTLRALADAGFEYDTSVAFNESVGYRLAIGFPFEPWDPISSTSIPIYEIPSVIMDGAYFYNRSQTVEETLTHFRDVLKNMKDYNAVAGLDWHVHTALPTALGFEQWGTALFKIYEEIYEDSEILVTSYKELVTLLKNYDRVLSLEEPGSEIGA